MNFDVASFDCYGQIWFAVLVQAVEDASVVLPPLVVHQHKVKCPPGCRRLAYTDEHYFQRTAFSWFRSTEETVGSFLWVCAILNIAPEIILDRIEERRRDVRKHRRRAYAKSTAPRNARALSAIGQAVAGSSRDSDGWSGA